jgi:hypothetical protein
MKKFFKKSEKRKEIKRLEKELVIARLKKMSDNLRVSIG